MIHKIKRLGNIIEIDFRGYSDLPQTGSACPYTILAFRDWLEEMMDENYRDFQTQGEKLEEEGTNSLLVENYLAGAWMAYHKLAQDFLDTFPEVLNARDSGSNE
jgi:hypothetical protein